MLFLTEGEDLISTLINKISARSLTLLAFAIGWTVAGRQPGHESMMQYILLSLSLLSV